MYVCNKDDRPDNYWGEIKNKLRTIPALEI